MKMPDEPTREKPDTNWIHYGVWEQVSNLLYSLPNYFETELVIKGINATEVFLVGSTFSSVVETQVVNILNSLRSIWDPDHRYAGYTFIRQTQTFPDVLLKHFQSGDVIFGIELKSWYVLSKEGEPSFRYQITPAACAPADLLVVTPWILSDVISGKPKLLQPYVELARYAAEYRNHYWQKSRFMQGKNYTIRKPPMNNCHPYPSSKQEALDKAEDDKGNNFGRIARAGILDEYINSLKEQDYLGVKIKYWIALFRAIMETREDVEIERRISLLRNNIRSTVNLSRSDAFIEILDRLENLWQMIRGLK
ncbi:hypothetical protein [Chloroflexus sp.]|uniref:hypothetical protein n=1 Tax=Chloroflexus sp. TaxID=1904827 RepID=UPI002ADE5267|nr:hypothetical protein [Chloroflexus sp.]